MPTGPDTYTKVEVNPSEVCYRAFELMQAKSYGEAEKLITSNMAKVKDDIALGLYHSSLGVLYKLKGEFETAFKHYTRAEDLLPADPAIKIITARLLIEHFADPDKAIKKVKKISSAVKKNPVFAHQVYTTLGLAYLAKGRERQASAMLTRSMQNGFQGFVSAENIDFHLIEAFLRCGMAVAESHEFLVKARDFARAQKEDQWVRLIDRMLDAFPKGNKGV